MLYIVVFKQHLYVNDNQSILSFCILSDLIKLKRESYLDPNLFFFVASLHYVSFFYFFFSSFNMTIPTTNNETAMVNVGTLNSVATQNHIISLTPHLSFQSDPIRAPNSLHERLNSPCFLKEVLTFMLILTTQSQSL